MDMPPGPGRDPLEAVPLGRTDVRVTPLSFGTGQLGRVPEKQAMETMQAAYDLGVRYFDSAPLYGFGRSERRLGRMLAAVDRGRLTVATKIGRLLRSGVTLEQAGPNARYIKDLPTDVLPIFDFSYDGAMRSFEESLSRLSLDSVDILYLHDPYDHLQEALDGAYRAMERLRREGAVRAIGVGMEIVDDLIFLARNTDIDCLLAAGRYTLADQRALPELLPICEARGIGVVVGSPLNTGLLVDPRPGAPFDFFPAAEHWVSRAMALKAVCLRHGVSLKAAALQFPLAHPAVACVLTGACTPAELWENLELLRTHIPTDLWAELKAEGLLPEEAPVPNHPT